MLRGDTWIDVARGQVLTTQMYLAQRWGWNRKTVRRFLFVLKRAQMVDIAAATARDNGYTLITILNYGKYQDLYSDNGTSEGVADGPANGTSREHRADGAWDTTEEFKELEEDEEKEEEPTAAEINRLFNIPPHLLQEFSEYLYPDYDGILGVPRNPQDMIEINNLSGIKIDSRKMEIAAALYNASVAEVKWWELPEIETFRAVIKGANEKGSQLEPGRI